MSMASGLTGELKCSICLSIYTNPVMLTCGHNFCETCIVNVLERQKRSGNYTCPECRKPFKSPHVLQRNIKLCNIVEHFLSSYQSPEKPSSNHVLIDPAPSVEHHKCPDHNEPLKYFCVQDSSPLCTTCAMSVKHHGHDLELISEAADKERLRLCDFVQKLTLQTEETENLCSKVEDYKRSMLKNVGILKNRVNDLFGGIREELNALERKVLAEINQQEKVVSKTCSREIQRIESEVSALYTKKIQIQQTCKIADDVTLLKHDDLDTDVKSIQIYVDKINEEMITVTMMNALCRLKEAITSVKEECGLCIEDSTDLVLNVNTADPKIALSYDLKEASDTHYKHKVRPHLPERFYSQQVLSTKRITTGKRYWEIKASEDGDWSVGVTYNSVKKSGYYSQLGKNEKSWCIGWSDLWDQLYAEHDDEREDLSSFTHELGIYLDYEGGFVSFYEIDDEIDHLYTFYHDFTQPLYFCIYANLGTCVTIC